MRLVSPEPTARHAGVTLIELMVAVAILAILLALAGPSFARQWADWRRESAVQAFLSELQLARSTALRTSRNVVVCISTDGVTCEGAASGGDWRRGSIVFADLDGNRQREAAEPLISRREALNGVDRLAGSASGNSIGFRSNGLLNHGSDSYTVAAAGAGTQDSPPTLLRLNAVGRAYRMELP